MNGHTGAGFLEGQPDSPKLVGESNESEVLINGQKTIALVDSGSMVIGQGPDSIYLR